MIYRCSLIPESARWHLQRKEYDAALKQLSWVAKLNRRSPPTMDMLKASGQEMDTTDSSQNIYTVVDLFATKTYAIRTSTLLFAWYVEKIHIMLQLNPTNKFNKGMNLFTR